ncbi:MAG: galactokinase [Desulfobacterales bacterium]|nr:galactokinase [Desulfobacterales bacterium]
MGGTLDISTFYYPLRHLAPCTFNIALNLRTQVKLCSYDSGQVKVSSKGFESAVYSLKDAPFDHPLGLMFAIAAYFRLEGVHILIESASPPKSGLGGSSAAAVALVAACLKMLKAVDVKAFSRQQTAILAHHLEAAVAGVPCGMQDQLAAAWGGVNAWYWHGDIKKPFFSRKTIVSRQSFKSLEDNLLLAYCGIPHESRNINSRWVQQFISGQYRDLWVEIVECTKKFIDAMMCKDLKKASALINREVSLRREMTPEVLDEMGEKLVASAIENHCGARFTGAGGGGCIWALGEVEDIGRLKPIWEETLSDRKGAFMIDVKIDSKGLSY